MPEFHEVYEKVKCYLLSLVLISIGFTSLGGSSLLIQPHISTQSYGARRHRAGVNGVGPVLGIPGKPSKEKHEAINIT